MKTPSAVPAHIAIIMDGNGRWASKRLLPRTAGHAAGLKRFAEITGICSDLGVRYLTVYAFSTENINRSAEEVSALLSLASGAIDTYCGKLEEKNIRVKMIGDLSMVGEELAQKIRSAESRLAHCTGMTLCIAFCYGGRHELAQAANRAFEAGETQFDDETLGKYLYTAGIPDPDLLIRTGGEKRISNFLLYQCAYSELYFCDTLWPDFDRSELEAAVGDFSKRKRRFGR